MSWVVPFRMSRGRLVAHPLPWYQCTDFFPFPDRLSGSLHPRFSSGPIRIAPHCRISFSWSYINSRCQPPKSLALCEVTHRTSLPFTSAAFRRAFGRVSSRFSSCLPLEGKHLGNVPVVGLIPPCRSCLRHLTATVLLLDLTSPCWLVLPRSPNRMWRILLWSSHWILDLVLGRPFSHVERVTCSAPSPVVLSYRLLSLSGLVTRKHVLPVIVRVCPFL